MPEIALEHVTKSYGTILALDNVSLRVKAGEAVGLVGESGSGKSTVASILAGLLRPDSGQCLFAGQDLTRLDKHAFRVYRREVQMVFQDFSSALNPCMSAGASVAEPLRNFERLERRDLDQRIETLLQQVGLSPTVAGHYPRSLSGGEQQRICIARALAAEPRFLLLDEVTSNLDVSIQAGILNLLADLRVSRGLGFLLISHDIALVRYLCDRVLVMHQGRIVEELLAENLTRTQHPYTQQLLASVPSVTHRNARRLS